MSFLLHFFRLAARGRCRANQTHSVVKLERLAAEKTAAAVGLPTCQQCGLISKYATMTEARQSANCVLVRCPGEERRVRRSIRAI